MGNKAELEDTQPQPVEHRERAGEWLPPIVRLRIPKVRTQTAKVRWLWAVGYPIKEIAKGTGIKYQQVRNMIVNQPKRAAREDLPPIPPEAPLEMKELVDDIQAIMDDELERSLRAGRMADLEARKGRILKGRRGMRAVGEPAVHLSSAGLNQDQEDLDGGALDDENYGRWQDEPSHN